MVQWKAVPNRFEHKVSIVTGGSSGIGLAVVRELCQEGASVLFTGLEIDDGAAVEEKLKEQGYDAVFLHGDMMDESFCRVTVDRAVKQWGKVHYLVNNAFSFVGKGMDAKTEDWMRSYFVGPIAYARMVQNVVKPMQDAGGGAIVNVSSVSAHIAQINRWTYNSAKGAVNQLTKCQALDLAKYNIRVNSVSPGFIWTREVERGSQLDGGGKAKWGRIWGETHMLGRCGEPIEAARPILFLLSDDASFITGTDLRVDGGYLGMGPEGIGKNTLNAGSV
jgi:NAD(P)-dependent dehydrogenase (short-subunit alcohol dehydrogenase family)